jgi:uroporphyrinogen decarboxylase
MNAKERVQTAFEHQIPDRVPTALWGGPYGLVDDLYFRLLEEFKLGDPIPQFRKGHTINYLDDRILDLLGTDTRYVWPGVSPTSPRYSTDDPERFFDDFGQPWIQTYPYFTATDGILEEAEDIKEIESRVNWPDPGKAEWTEGVRERAEGLSQIGEHYIVARMVVSHGPFQLASDLRGTSTMMLDMGLNPDFATALLQKVTDIICGLLEGYLKAGNGHFDMIELPGDDYASNENLIISPEMFRFFIKPCIRRMVATIHEIQPEIKIMLHSDGAIQKLIPDFIDLGIDVLHPLEPVVGTDVKAVKQEFGNDIAFIGGIDITRAMTGTVKSVKADVDRCLSDLAPGGGYVLAPCNHLQADVPAENVIELFKYAQEKGRY